MAFNLGKMIEGPSYAILNEILGEFRTNDGFARPSRYEVILFPPSGQRGTNTLSSNVYASLMSQNVGDGTVRETSLKCEQISFPGRNIDTSTDTNIYGPTREIASGFSFTEITAKFQCSSDQKEKRFFETSG